MIEIHSDVLKIRFDRDSYKVLDYFVIVELVQT